jgi:hypothetical protein
MEYAHHRLSANRPDDHGRTCRAAEADTDRSAPLVFTEVQGNGDGGDSQTEDRAHRWLGHPAHHIHDQPRRLVRWRRGPRRSARRELLLQFPVGAGEQHRDRVDEGLKVLRAAARHEVAVVNERLVEPSGAGIDEVVAKAGPRRQTPAL